MKPGSSNGTLPTPPIQVLIVSPVNGNHMAVKPRGKAKRKTACAKRKQSEKGNCTGQLTREFWKRLRAWAHNTTIHGIEELFATTSPVPFRIMWGTIILTALGILSYQTFRLTKQYTSYNTATRMGITEIVDYPPTITYCTNRAIDDRVVRKLGLGEYALIDLMTIYFGASKLFVSPDTVRKIKESRTKLQNVFSILNFTYFEDIMNSITRPHNELFDVPVGYRTVNLIEKVGSRYGPCYRIYFEKPKQKAYRFGSFQIFVKRPEIAPFVADLYKGTFTKDEIYFISFGNKQVPYNIDGNSDATIKATYRKRLSTPSNPCRYDDENPVDVTHCQDQCENYRMKKCFGCIIYSNTSRVDTYFCGFLDFQEALALNITARRCYQREVARLHECSKDCIKHQPCNDWMFDVFVLPRQFRDVHQGNRTVGLLTLTVREPHSSVFMEEYFTYPIEQYVSDLGGQLGLFFGASVLSFLQLIYFFCRSYGE